MSRRRALTDDQCRELAEWYVSRSSLTDKARELNVSKGTLRDAILRGQGKDVGYLRRKLSSVEIQRLVDELNAPRETDNNSQNSEVT